MSALDIFEHTLHSLRSKSSNFTLSVPSYSRVSAGAAHAQAGWSQQLRLSQGQTASGSDRSRSLPSGRCRSRVLFPQSGYYQQGGRNDQKNRNTRTSRTLKPDQQKPFSTKLLPLLTLPILCTLCTHFPVIPLYIFIIIYNFFKYYRKETGSRLHRMHKTT